MAAFELRLTRSPRFSGGFFLLDIGKVDLAGSAQTIEMQFDFLSETELAILFQSVGGFGLFQWAFKNRHSPYKPPVTTTASASWGSK